VLKDSKSLHLEYFKFELLFLYKVLARRNVLGLDVTSTGEEVLLVVYRNACKHIPNDCVFRVEFVKMAKPFFNGPAQGPARQVAKAIIEDIEVTFGARDAITWDLLAR
jgi:hypothetical protein